MNFILHRNNSITMVGVAGQISGWKVLRKGRTPFFGDSILKQAGVNDVYRRNAVNSSIQRFRRGPSLKLFLKQSACKFAHICPIWLTVWKFWKRETFFLNFWSSRKEFSNQKRTSFFRKKKPSGEQILKNYFFPGKFGQIEFVRFLRRTKFAPTNENARKVSKQ